MTPLPCPWCGGAAVALGNRRIGFFGQCLTETCIATGPMLPTEVEAVATWNAVAAKCRAHEPLRAVYDALDSCVELTPEVMLRARAALAGGGE